MKLRLKERGKVGEREIERENEMEKMKESKRTLDRERERRTDGGEKNNTHIY